MSHSETKTAPPDQVDNVDERETSHEGGYGWVCVACTFLINVHTWGINSAYSVFLSYYLSNDIFPGMTSLEYAFVGGLSISCAMLISPLVTFLSRRFSTQLVLNIGTVLEALSLITTSFARTNWQLFLSQGVCFGFGMGFLFAGSVGVVSHWFKRKRSLVNGITSAGSGTGGLIYSLAVNAMIPRLGFPWTVRTLGIICFAVNIVCGNLLRTPESRDFLSIVKNIGSKSRKKDEEVTGPTTKKAGSQGLHLSVLREPSFIALIAWGVLSSLGYVALIFSMSSYSVAVGLTQQQGSIASALLNLGMAFGRPAMGFLSDAWGRINVTFAASFAPGLFCLVIWIFATSPGVIYFFAILVGLFAGTLWAATPPLAAEAVGLDRLPDALGLIWLALTPPTAVTEAIALQLRDSSTAPRPYMRVQIFVGFMYIGAALALIPFRYLLSRRARAKSAGSE